MTHTRRVILVHQPDHQEGLCRSRKAFNEHVCMCVCVCGYIRLDDSLSAPPKALKAPLTLCTCIRQKGKINLPTSESSIPLLLILCAAWPVMYLQRPACGCCGSCRGFGAARWRCVSTHGSFLVPARKSTPSVNQKPDVTGLVRPLDFFPTLCQRRVLNLYSLG